MNRLSDIIEMGGNLFEEAYNIGRREALKEVNCGKYEMLEETNRSLRAQIDSYEKIRLTQDEEIHRLKADLEKTWEEKETLQVKHDNCGRNWREASKEIDRLTAKVKRLVDEKQMLTQQLNALAGENDLLGNRVSELMAKIDEQAAALAIYRVPTPRACPFCGGPAEVHQLHKDEWYVVCGNGDCPVNPETNTFDTEADAIEAWNHSYEVPKVTCDWR